MNSSEQVYGGDHFPPQRRDVFVPCHQVSGNMVWFCKALERAIGGVVMYSVGVNRTDWEVRVFRYMPGYGDAGVSTYIPRARLEAMSSDEAQRLGELRGRIINGIFVDGGAL